MAIPIFEGNFFAHAVSCLSDDKQIIRFPKSLFCMYQSAIDLISEQYYSIGKHMTEMVSYKIERAQSWRIIVVRS